MNFSELTEADEPRSHETSAWCAPSSLLWGNGSSGANWKQWESSCHMGAWRGRAFFCLQRCIRKRS